MGQYVLSGWAGKIFHRLIVPTTVLRTVLTDLKNKHDLDIYDLRNAQNFAKIL